MRTNFATLSDSQKAAYRAGHSCGLYEGEYSLDAYDESDHGYYKCGWLDGRMMRQFRKDVAVRNEIKQVNNQISRILSGEPV